MSSSSGDGEMHAKIAQYLTRPDLSDAHRRPHNIAKAVLEDPNATAKSINRILYAGEKAGLFRVVFNENDGVKSNPRWFIMQDRNNHDNVEHKFRHHQ